MKIVLQAVSRASVSVDGEAAGAIGKGFLLLLGVADSDIIQIADKIVGKICRLRILHNENGKTNLSLADVGGELLAINQFTLYADCKEGDRPNFIRAGKPDKAKQLYEYVTEWCWMYVSEVEHGIFGTDMKVELMSDGPLTLVLDSEELRFQ